VRPAKAQLSVVRYQEGARRSQPAQGPNSLTLLLSEETH